MTNDDENELDIFSATDVGIGERTVQRKKTILILTITG